MNVPLQLKQITQHTTQVAFSTGFLLGGCAVVGREEEAPETVDVDAGEDAIIEAVHFDRDEAASHQYHQAPIGDAPVVMPLELEDAPTTPPPASALAKPKNSNRKPAKDDDCEVAHRDAADAVSRATRRVVVKDRDVVEDAERPVRAEKKPERDPIAESFLRTGGGGSLSAPRTTGTRY
jgi:hypothetical protein